MLLINWEVPSHKNARLLGTVPNNWLILLVFTVFYLCTDWVLRELHHMPLTLLA